MKQELIENKPESHKESAARIMSKVVSDLDKVHWHLQNQFGQDSEAARNLKELISRTKIEARSIESLPN